MIWQELPFKFDVNFDNLSLGGIYMMTMDTGYYYIGSTKNFKTRISCHKTSFRKNYPDNERLRIRSAECKTIRFDVLEVVEDMASLKLREIFYLSAKYGDPFLININIHDGDNLATERRKERKRSTKITSDKGRPVYFKKVINTSTGEVFNSTAEIAAKTGLPVRYYNRRMNGERRNNTPYKYVERERSAVYKG